MFQAPNEAIESAVKMQPTPLHLATRRSWTGLLDTITKTSSLSADASSCVSMALPNPGALDGQVRRP